MNHVVSDPLETLRVRAHLGLIPLVAVALALSWVMQIRAQTIATLGLICLPLLTLMLLVFTWLLWRSPRYLRVVDWTMLASLGVYLLLDFSFYQIPFLRQQQTFGAGSNWFSAIYLLSYLLLPPRQALVYNLVYFGLFFALGLPVLLTSPSPNAANTLIQFYAANGTALGLLHVLSQLRRYYTEALQVAQTDALTGLLNRRSMQQQLEDYVRSGRNFSLMMLDIDHFKQINDRHGHPLGDQVLKEVARILDGHLRGSDLLSRWGGEEFLILAPDTDRDQAEAIAVRLRLALQQRPVAGGLRVTLSIGIAAHEPGEALERLLARADQALYQAKNAGRDRAEVSA